MRVPNAQRVARQSRRFVVARSRRRIDGSKATHRGLTWDVWDRNTQTRRSSHGTRKAAQAAADLKERGLEE